MSEAARVGAVVLAGGRSSRFGRDKLAEPIDGRPMLDHAIDAVRAVATDVVVVVSSGSPSAVVRAGLRVVGDPVAYEGPLAGLATGLRALDPSVDHAIVVGGDMPTLVPAVLRRLIGELDGHDLAVLADDDGPRPLPMAVVRSTAIDVVERLLDSGERRLRALLQELTMSVLPPAIWRLDDPTGASLRDVDLPGDLPG
jgi:molybdenum cofactor guanylyltransferase